VPNLTPRPDLGDIVELYAVDWAVYADQRPRESAWGIVKARLYGEVIHMDEESITIAPQAFVDGDVRFALSAPWATIETIKILQHKEGEHA
jgi:hypothetical protein